MWRTEGSVEDRRPCEGLGAVKRIGVREEDWGQCGGLDAFVEDRMLCAEL